MPTPSYTIEIYGKSTQVGRLLNTMLTGSSSPAAGGRGVPLALVQALRNASYADAQEGVMARIVIEHERALPLAERLVSAAARRGLRAELQATQPATEVEPILSDRLDTLLRHGTKTAGSFDPSAALPCIEEELTPSEFEQAKGFLSWLKSNGRTFGWNIQEVYADYVKDVVPPTNTALDLMYRDGDNYKRFERVVLAGLMTQAQYDAIKAKLEDGEYLIAHQVGLPTPAEQNYGYDNWPNDDFDHVFTTLTDFSEGVSVEKMYTRDEPTLDMTVDEFIAKVAAVKEWGVAAEWGRQKAVAGAKGSAAKGRTAAPSPE